MRTEVLSLVLESINIDEDTMEKRIFQNGRFEYIEAVEKNTFADVTFLVYQCNGNFYFSYDEYKDVKQKIENSKEMNSFFVPIFVFDDLDCETDQYERAYKNLVTAEERKALRILFEEKKSVYTRKGKVSLEVEDAGINFLEYGREDTKVENINLEGYIYNVSYYQLEKLFVISGKDLFRENIRYGLNKENYTKKKLVKNFEKYLKVGVFEKICKDAKMLHVKWNTDNLKTYLEIDEESITQFIPGIFWFNHNGVTIFVSGQKINRCNSTIEFFSGDASIINGAQTMTNLYKTVNEVKKLLSKLFEKDLKDVADKLKAKEEEIKDYVCQLVDEICKTIYLKTIIIEGDKKYVKGISDGLNTQIPISEVDILAGSSDVNSINEILASENIRIVKEGEPENRSQLSVLNFAKKYKIISGIPGTSKNLNRNTVDTILKEAAGNKQVPDLAQKLRMVMDADEWWTRNRKKELVKVEEDEINICKYGRNYFESYVILRMPENTDDDELSNLFVEFIKDAKKAPRDKTMSEFKKDDLFLEIKEVYREEVGTALKGKKKTEIIKEKLPLLCEYINNNKVSKYNMSSIITRFFENEDIPLDKFRVVNLRKTKDGYAPAEAFPFSSGTFSELYINKDYSKEVKIKEFEESKFWDEIKNDFSIFVIVNDESTIKKIVYLNDISFRDYKEEAKIVYDKTANAFREGNEEDFTKASDNLGFHIRPKAQNADDTFEFSNGKEITKRTFWANKNLIKQILYKHDIENLINEH